MAPIKGRKSAANKNLPVLSHEFVIQNHADIVSCVAMVIVIGLMVQVSTLRRVFSRNFCVSPPRSRFRSPLTVYIFIVSVDFAGVFLVRGPAIRPDRRTESKRLANIWYRSQGSVRHILLFSHLHHIPCHHSRICIRRKSRTSNFYSCFKDVYPKCSDSKIIEFFFFNATNI